jgi:PhnB protein
MTGIAPWILVRDAGDALAFYRAAFGAVAVESHEDDTGALQVAQLWIGAADFWIQTDTVTVTDATTATTETAGGPPVHMILSVDEPDVVFGRALAAGAIEINPMADAYGWRIGKVADPFGHVWEIGRRLENGNAN